MRNSCSRIQAKLVEAANEAYTIVKNGVSQINTDALIETAEAAFFSGLLLKDYSGFNNQKVILILALPLYYHYRATCAFYPRRDQPAPLPANILDPGVFLESQESSNFRFGAS